MKKIIKYFLIIFILFNFKAFAKENFFQEAKILFEKGKIEESKFLFQRNIVFNPKDSKSYLYLAKIFESEEDCLKAILNKEHNVGVPNGAVATPVQAVTTMRP